MFQWSTVWHFLFVDSNHLFLLAAWTTLWISVVAQCTGVILGLFLALMRMSRYPYLSLPARAFVLVAFSLNEGAYMSEIVRAGITSVDVGQMEAAKSLGMRYALAMRRVVLPQAARVIIPPLGNEFNNMLKNTSIASVIGLLELTGTAEVYGSQNFVIFELLIVATVWYLLLTTGWGYIQNWIENRLDPNRTLKTDLVQKGWAARMLGFGSPRAGDGGTLAGGR